MSALSRVLQQTRRYVHILLRPRAPPRVSTTIYPRRTPSQLRFLSNNNSNNHKKEDPFQVLGLTPGSSYQTAKEAFLKLALEHHPDKQNGKTNDNTSDHFIRIRQAFEVIKEGANGQALVTDETQWTQEEIHEFMEEQTSHFLSFRMDHATRKEVIETHNNLSEGGLDRGGTWMMARMLAEREKTRLENSAKTPKQIVASNVVRRKRK